jgi:hypothetical protein
VDTSRVWIEEDYVIGADDGRGKDSSNALTVSQASVMGPQNDVWVSGYIVGGDLTSASASFNAPFSSATNLLLGPKSGTVDRNACIAVQLPSGRVRSALNLAEHPELLGRKVCLYGDIVESYFSLTGLKNVSDFQMQ